MDGAPLSWADHNLELSTLLHQWKEGLELNHQDGDSKTVLHESIMRECWDVFSYVIKQPGIQLDLKDVECSTPLLLAVQLGSNPNFALELIKAGANIFVTDHSLNTPLHLVKNLTVAKELLKKGAEIDARNRCNDTPLHLACSECQDSICTDLIYLYLYYGANTNLKNDHNEWPFEICISEDCQDSDLLQILFEYTFDCCEQRAYDCRFFRAAMRKSSFLLEAMIERTAEILIHPGDYLYFKEALICDHDLFVLFVNKFSYAVKKNLRKCDIIDVLLRLVSPSNQENILQNLELIVNRQLYFDCDDGKLIAELTESWYKKCKPLDDLNGIVLSFLSYGQTISMYDLCSVYNQYGFCDLFQLLLYMDVNLYEDTDNLEYSCLMPFLITNVTGDLKSTLNLRKYLFAYADTKRVLLHFTALPKFKWHSSDLWQFETGDLPLSLPKIPLLLELARNSVRLFIIKRYKIKKCWQFYTVLERLPLPTICKDIIAYKLPLYD